MSILAQCGYGRGNKIELGLKENSIRGVIMSPRDERRDRLEQAIQDWGSSYQNTLIMFDPQFYAVTLNNPRDGHLSEFDYYNNNSGLGRAHFSGTRIRQYVKTCLDYQHQTFGKNVAYLISPTILFDGFRDSWSQISLNMAVESADYHITLNKPQPLLISIVISETAFQSLDAMEEFLDAVTEIDTQGFYIIIRRNAISLQNAIEASPFGRFMYFCYVLTTINKYDVIVGYCDWYSFLLDVAGVTHSANGWYQNLRQFSLLRFKPPAGGRRPRKRYSSTPLLSCPLINPELQDIYQTNLLPRVLSGSKHDIILQNNPISGEANWSDEISCLVHWFSLSSLSQQICSKSTPLERIQEAEQIMLNALSLYTQLGIQGISFDPATGPVHIREWQDSLQEYRSLIGV